MLIPYDEKVYNEEVLPFKNHLVLLQRFQGMRRLRVYEILSSNATGVSLGESHDITFEEAAYSLKFDSLSKNKKQKQTKTKTNKL